MNTAALELVHGMAVRLYQRHGELDPATSPAEAQEALDTVEDFIVNNFESDEDETNIQNHAEIMQWKVNFCDKHGDETRSLIINAKNELDAVDFAAQKADDIGWSQSFKVADAEKVDTGVEIESFANELEKEITVL